MKSITAAGRYMFAIPFLVFGVMHLINGSSMTAMVPLPGGILWVYVAGVAMILAGVSIIVGKKDVAATFLLGFLLLIYVLTIHLPAMINTGGTDAIATTNLLKDFALAGAAWVYSRSAARDRTTSIT